MNSVFETIERHTSKAEPVKIEPLILELGIELDKKAELPKDIAGQLELLSDGRFKILVNNTDHYFRKRFTMAHELGHFVFHKHLIGSGINDNRLYRSSNPQITEAHEVEANKFAASLLMPLRHVTRDYKDMGNVEKVANKWQVSPKAMKIRLGLPA